MLLPLQVFCCKSDIAKAPKDGLKGNLCLEPHQRRADAKVNAKTETEMPSLVARDLKAVGVREAARVAIRGSDNRVNQIVFANRLTADFSIFKRRTICDLDGVIVTEDFF